MPFVKEQWATVSSKCAVAAQGSPTRTLYHITSYNIAFCDVYWYTLPLFFTQALASAQNVWKKHAHLKNRHGFSPETVEKTKILFMFLNLWIVIFLTASISRPENLREREMYREKENSCSGGRHYGPSHNVGGCRYLRNWDSNSTFYSYHRDTPRNPRHRRARLHGPTQNWTNFLASRWRPKICGTHL